MKMRTMGDERMMFAWRHGGEIVKEIGDVAAGLMAWCVFGSKWALGPCLA